MAFRFPLATLLRFRESNETAEELALNRIVNEIASVQLELRALEEGKNRVREQRDRELSRPVPAVQLQEIVEQEQRLNEAWEALRNKLEELEGRREAQLESYGEARQKREILSEIFDRQREGYRRTEERKEQAAVDELFLWRREGGE